MSNEASHKAAVLAVSQATSESTERFVQASVEAGITSAAVAGLNTRAADHLQVVLTEAIDALLTKDHQPLAKFGKGDEGWAAVLEARNDLYYGLIKRTREAGKAQYEADRKAGTVRVARSGKAKGRKQYGKDARSNISNKREDIRNIFWSLQSPDLAAEVRAIMKPAPMVPGPRGPMCAGLPPRSSSRRSPAPRWTLPTRWVSRRTSGFFGALWMTTSGPSRKTALRPRPSAGVPATARTTPRLCALSAWP